MEKKYLVIILSVLLLLPFYGLKAQSENSSSKVKKAKVDFGADLVSRYIWRGIQLGGNVPNIQPTIHYNNGGFEAGVWGSFSIAGSNYSDEVDLYVSQTFANSMFTVSVTDYFFPVEFGNYKYFEYRKDSTGHVFEGTFAYNGIKNFPLTALIAVNFYGADAARIDDNPQSPDFNKKTGIQYSTYLELGYPFKISDIDINTYIGFNLTAPKKADSATGFIGETGFYGNSIGVVNLGFTASKSIPITKQFALPVSISLITNPQSEKIYFVFGISF